MLLKFARFLPLMAVISLACTTAEPVGPEYVATATVEIGEEEGFAAGRLVAIREATQLARDQILARALAELKFTDGRSLELVAITDPFIRAKIYDTIRTARITGQQVDPENNLVSVTLTMPLGPLHHVLARY